MNPQRKIELALRAGKVAKDALELTSVSEIGMARLLFNQLVLQVRDLDTFLKSVEQK